MMNLYEQQLTSALQSRISNTSNDLFSLELWVQVYKHTGNKAKLREAKDELLKLSLDQTVNKRLMGYLQDSRRYTNYLNDIVDEYCLVSK